MSELVTLLVTSVLINNVILNQFLGIVSFYGRIEEKVQCFRNGCCGCLCHRCSRFGHLCVILSGFGTDWFGIYGTDHLYPGHRIVSTVNRDVYQKYSPSLYKSLGVYLPLITTNCVVLNVCLVNITNAYDFSHMLVYSVGTPLGFALVLYIFSTIRERLELSNVPAAFKGNGIA